jgi:hypothetical protein
MSSPVLDAPRRAEPGANTTGPELGDQGNRWWAALAAQMRDTVSLVGRLAAMVAQTLDTDSRGEQPIGAALPRAAQGRTEDTGGLLEPGVGAALMREALLVAADRTAHTVGTGEVPGQGEQAWLALELEPAPTGPGELSLAP